MILKPIIVMWTCVHSLEHCKLGSEQHVYQCFSTTRYAFFIFYFTGTENIITSIVPLPRNRLSLSRLFKRGCLPLVVYLVGSVSIAGNIYFALLPVEEDTAALFSSWTVIVPLTRQLPYSLLSELALV